MDEENLSPHRDGELMIFRSLKDRTSTDLSQIGDFMTDGIRALTHEWARAPQATDFHLSPAQIALAEQALRLGEHLLHGEYEYLLDFDSLPEDVLEKFRKGIYHLGESKQVENNLRAVIVDQNGTRVKDLTLKKVRRTVISEQSLLHIALQRCRIPIMKKRSA